MSDSPWFPMYPADFLAATLSWENDAVGVYVRLLLHQWVNGRIPIEDNRELCRAAGVFPDELPKYQHVIDSKFPRGKNQRLEEERKKRNERRKNGKQGGRPPKNPPVEKANDNQTHNHSDNQKPPPSETKSPDKIKGSQSQSHPQSYLLPQPEGGGAPPALSPIESGLKNFLEACDIEYIPGGISSETMGAAMDRRSLFIDLENNMKLCRHAKAWRAKRKRDEEAKGQRFRPVSVPVAMANIDDILATDPGSNGSGRVRIKDMKTLDELCR